MACLSYSPEYLKSLNNPSLELSPDIQCELKEIQKYVKRSKRGCRGGRKLQRPISVIEGHRPLNMKVNSEPRPPSVLKPVQPHQLPPQSPTHIDPNSELPGFFYTNTRSALNKTDEIGILLHQTDFTQIDIAVLTETWQAEHVSDEFLAVEGFNIFTKSRSAKRGGGVAS